MPFSKSSDTLDIQSVRGGWVLREDLFYWHGESSTAVMAEEDFISDLASIPGIANVIVSNDDYRIRRPAIIHDWLYCFVGHMHSFEYKGGLYPSKIINRAHADMIFKHALEEEGVGWMKRNLMWLAVRAVGWRYWGK